MKIGMFLVGCKEWETFEAMEKLASMGYEGVELRVKDAKADPGDLSADDVIRLADKLKAKAKETGLEIPSMASYVHCLDLKDSIRHLEACAAVGAKCVRIGSGNYDLEGPPCWDQLKESRKCYVEIAKHAARLGIRAVVETHGRRRVPTVLAARTILDGLDPKHVGIMWDPANQVREGLERYEMALDLAGEYLAEVHVKNSWYVNRGEKNGRLAWECKATPLHKGIVDYPRVIELLKARSYDGWLMLENFSKEQPLLERLQFDHDYLRAMM